MPRRWLLFVMLTVCLGTEAAVVPVGSIPTINTVRGVPFSVSMASYFNDTEGLPLSLSAGLNPSGALPSWLDFHVPIDSSAVYAGNCRKVRLSGQYAFVSCQSPNLLVFDVSQSDAPQFVTSYFVNSQMSYDIEIVDDFAFLAIGNSGVRIINISNPMSISYVSNYATGATVYAVQVVGSYLYIAADTNGIIIVDISNPSSPSFVGQYTRADSARDLAVLGDIVYGVFYSDGVRVIDTSNKTNPVVGAGLDWGDVHNCVTLKDNRLFVGQYQYLRIASIDVPSSPSSIASLLPHSFSFQTVGDIFVVGHLVYVAWGWAGLRIVDISNPGSPQLLHDLGWSEAESVAIRGNQAYGAGVAGFFTASGADLRSNVLQGSAPGTVASTTTIKITAKNQNSQTATQLVVVNVAADQAVAAVGTVADQTVLFGTPFNITLDQTSLFSNEVDQMLTTWVSGVGGGPIPTWLKTRPTVAGTTYVRPVLESDLHDFELTGDYAVVASGSYLDIFQISEPWNPTRLAHFSISTTSCLDVQVVGNSAYLTSWYYFHNVDISNKANPVYVRSYDAIDNGVLDVFVDGVAAYVLTNQRLEILDISTPTAPVSLDTYVTPGTGVAVVVVRDIAYIADTTSLLALNVSDPTNIQYVGTIPQSITRLAVEDCHLYCAGSSSIFVVDICTSAMQLTGGAVAITAGRLTVQHPFLYAPSNDAVVVVDVSDPTQPFVVDQFDLGIASNYVKVVLRNNALYVTHRGFGFSVTPLTQWKLEGTPTEADIGEYTIELHAKDFNGASAVQTFQITVAPSTTGLATTGVATTGAVTTGTATTGLMTTGTVTTGLMTTGTATTGLMTTGPVEASYSPSASPSGLPSTSPSMSSNGTVESSSSMTDSIEAVPAAGGSSGEAVVGAIVGAVVGVCLVLLIVAAVVVWFVVSRSRQTKKPKESDVELQSDHMAYQKGNKSVFEALLESYELYDKRFRLLTTINQPLAIEIKKQVGYDFQRGKPIETEVSGVLGSGNFGETMFAYDQQNKMFVLCKVIRGADACQNSQSEAEMHRLVSGKAGVIALLKHGDFTTSDDDMRYVTFLEYANFGSGEKLALLLAQVQSSPLKTKLIAHCVKQLLNGLLSLKQAKLFHADIKLSNIVCHIEDGEDAGKRLVMKLIDFGCSQVIPEGSKISSDIGDTSIFSLQRVNLHKKRQFQGMSEGTLIASKEDIWAMGLALFELVTGKDSSTLFMSHAYLSDRSVPLLEQSEFDAKKSAIVELQDTEEDSVFDLINLMLTVDASSRASVELLLRHAFVENNTFSDADEETKAVQMLFKNNELPVADTQQPEQAGYAKSPPTKEVYLKNGTQVREKPRHAYQNVDHYTGVWFDE